MSADCEAKTGSGPTGGLAERIRQEAVHLTPQDIRRVLKGIPLKAKLALRAATLLPQGSLTVQLPDKRVFKVGGNAAGPDAVLILHNWNLPRRALSESTIGVAET